MHGRMSESWRQPVVGVVYPESDGEPMGETQTHVEELIALREALVHRFRDDPDTYVAGNMFVYWREGDPRAVFCPDVFFVRGVDKRRRRTFKLWDEGHPPTFVLELSSESTWLEDVGNKKALCARLGVREYFLCDPEGLALHPPLQGFRLERDDYRRIAPAPDGSVASDVLGLELYLDDTLRLHARDRQTREVLLRTDEIYLAREEAEARASKAERQLEALRAELLAPRRED